jgi:broad specificity phosphatase PhoE
MLEVQTRMTDELNHIARQYPDGTVAVFSHQDTIKAAIAHVLGLPLDLFSRFEIGPASVSVLKLAEWGPTLVTLNSPSEG